MQRCNENGYSPLGTKSCEGDQDQQQRLLQVNHKRKTRENVDPLLNEVDALITEDTEKAKLLNALLASLFTAKTLES